MIIRQEMGDVFTRAFLSPAERDLPSRVAQLVSGSWFLCGTLSERSGKCGKPTCHCTKGELHQVPVPGSEPWRQASSALCPAGHRFGRLSTIISSGNACWKKSLSGNGSG